MKNLAARCLAGVLLLASGSAPLPVAAQPGPAQAQIPVLPVPPTAIRIPCCRCLDGHTQAVTINTRAAPWRVDPPGVIPFQPVVPANNAAWVPLPPAGWVGPPGAPAFNSDYVYQLQIYVRRCIIPSRVSLAGRFAADNRGRMILDGNQIAVSSTFTALGVAPFSALLGPGLHTLNVIVHNDGGPTGLIVQGAITIICPRELEQGGGPPLPGPGEPVDPRPSDPGV